MIGSWLRRRQLEAEQRILSAMDIAESDTGWHYGFDVMRACRFRSARFYTALRRLETAGFVEAKWDDTEDPPPKYRRRMYRIAKEAQ